MIVQSVIFKKDKWSVKEAIDWLIKNGFKVKKIDVKKNSYRFRQRPPNFMRYVTKDLGNGIELIMGI